MLPKIITSLHNQRVKDAAKLRERRQREKQGRTLIDGAREIARAIDAEVELAEAFVCEPLCSSADCRSVVGRLDEIAGTVWRVFGRGVRKNSPSVTGQKECCRCDTAAAHVGPVESAAKGPRGGARRDRKAGQRGSGPAQRDGAGVSAVIVADGATDLYNPNCIRASLGTVFTMQVCGVTVDETIAWLREREFKVFAARVDARQNYSDVDFRPGKRHRAGE